MPRGLLYNPSNDGALACNTYRYTPPRIARVLERDLAQLPQWWAEPGDLVLLPGTDLSGVDECIPWGWSPDAVRRFIDAGVAPEKLPDAEAIERIRQLSHRRISVEVNRRLAASLPDLQFPPLPVEIDRAEELDKLPGDADLFVKQPWSCSGRGVHRYEAGRLGSDARTKIAAMIARAGSVTVERALDRVLDFAALFYNSAESGIMFRGLSLFDTTPTGAYIGNRMASEDQLRARIGEYISLNDLDRVVAQLEAVLGELTGDAYTGWLGVDMMVYSAGGEMRLAPCVEVNLRMTMGVVAHLLRSHAELRRYLPATLSVLPLSAVLPADKILASGAEVAAVVRKI